MLVRMFFTSIKRTQIVIDALRNGSYEAYEVHTRGEGGNVILRRSWSLDWLINTLRMYYMVEELIREI